VDKLEKLTKWNIQHNTFGSELVYEDLIDKIKAYESDNEPTNRIDVRRECKSCYYLKKNRIVTQAYTDYKCWNCDSRHTHHNGGVPRYCVICSIEYDICVRCGSEL
jgi:hypothetical protein